MSVSVYYRAQRAVPPTPDETSTIERIVAAHVSSFPYRDEESLHLYETGGDTPAEILAGATKMPTDPDRMIPVLTCVLDTVSELRRAVPGAEWSVHLDDLDVPWDENDGYAFPGMHA
ncbi:MAG TPA: hypothetical protein H9881_02415 [Candidatus Stackebrandtia excrementipullorum]|nr:hypothetical protein [Candidatus Stackebrandtia excrementipullorum]